MWLCHFVNCYFSIILTVSVCTEQNLLFPCFIFFQLGNLFDFGSCTPFFLFSQHLSLGISSRHSVAVVWGFPKRFSVQRVGRVVEGRRGRGEERRGEDEYVKGVIHVGDKCVGRT